MSREQYVQLRRAALQELKTHHLSGNIEIEALRDTAQLKVSMLIYRRSQAEDVLTTHCLYFFGAERRKNRWLINLIRQKVL